MVFAESPTLEKQLPVLVEHEHGKSPMQAA